MASEVPAEEILPTYRQCAIELKNECHSYILCDHRDYISSGTCASPFPVTIDPLTSASALYTKTPNTARGSVGVFTFDLQQEDTEQIKEKIAVMFEVPYDFNLYSNWYAVGVFDKSRQCDASLFYEMYNNTDNETFIRGKASCPGLTFKGGQVTIRATMTDSYQPVMKVQVTQNSSE